MYFLRIFRKVFNLELLFCGLFVIVVLMVGGGVDMVGC